MLTATPETGDAAARRVGELTPDPNLRALLLDALERLLQDGEAGRAARLEHLSHLFDGTLANPGADPDARFRLGVIEGLHADAVASGGADNETANAIGRLILETFPVSSNLLSAREAYVAYAAAVDALSNGDTLEALKQAALGTVFTVEAFPGLGNAVKIGRRVGEAALDLRKLFMTGQGRRRGKGDGTQDADARRDREPREEQPDEPDDRGREDGTDPKTEDVREFDPKRIRLPEVSKTRDPLTADDLAAMQPGELIDPHRLRTLQRKADDVFKPEEGRQRRLVDTIRQFFEDDDLAEKLPVIRIFVDANGDVWTLDHRRVVAARIATEIAEAHGIDKVFKLRFRVVSRRSKCVREEIRKKFDRDPLDGLSIRIHRR